MRIPIADAALLAFQMAEHMQVTRLSSGLIGIGHYHFHLVGHQIVQAHAVQTGEIGRLVERRSTLIAFPIGNGLPRHAQRGRHLLLAHPRFFRSFISFSPTMRYPFPSDSIGYHSR